MLSSLFLCMLYSFVFDEVFLAKVLAAFAMADLARFYLFLDLINCLIALVISTLPFEDCVIGVWLASRMWMNSLIKD